MQDLNDKINGSILTPSEFNEIASEIQNTIIQSGQALSSGDLAQLSKAATIVLATLTAMRALTLGSGTAILNGHTTVGDGGGGIFYWSSTSTSADNNGTIIKLTSITVGRYIRIYSGAINVRWFGATGDGSTDDSAAIQAVFNIVKLTGGVAEFDGGLTYICNSQLTLQSTTTTPKTVVVNFNGAMLNFSSSGLTSGALLLLGATSIANAHDQELVTINDPFIQGPESNPTESSTASGSTIGIQLDNALRHVVNNAVVQGTYKGFQTNDSWDLQFNSPLARESYIGFHISNNSTYATWIQPQSVDNRYGYLISPVATGKFVTNQTFIGARSEGNFVGFVLDPGIDANNGINSVKFINPYSEGSDYDVFRIGLQWTIGSPITRNSVAVGFVVNSDIDGGYWAGEANWGANHAPIVFPTSGNTVTGGAYSVPVGFADTVGIPVKYHYRNKVDVSDGLGDNVTSDHFPGFGVGVITGRGTNGAATLFKGNPQVVSANRDSIGQYTLTLQEAYNNGDNIIVAATCDAGTVNVLSTTATTVVLQCYDRGGTQSLFDPGFIRVSVFGTLT